MCPNCQSQKHLACCARCGALLRRARRLAGYAFCTARCARVQTKEDYESAEAEAWLVDAAETLEPFPVTGHPRTIPVSKPTRVRK